MYAGVLCSRFSEPRANNNERGKMFGLEGTGFKGAGVRRITRAASTIGDSPPRPPAPNFFFILTPENFLEFFFYFEIKSQNLSWKIIFSGINPAFWDACKNIEAISDAKYPFRLLPSLV